MTINQILECALGKEVAMSCGDNDCSPFTPRSTEFADKLVEKMSKNIQKYGFSPTGKETMYSGTTGEMLKAKIFIGPTYYQRLKHMVDDKMHVRARGQYTVLTRQCTDGRARAGQPARKQIFILCLLILQQ